MEIKAATTGITRVHTPIYEIILGGLLILERQPLSAALLSPTEPIAVVSIFTFKFFYKHPLINSAHNMGQLRDDTPNRHA